MVETSETEAESSPVDSGSVTLPELDGPGMMETVAGEGFWYRPLIDPVITLLDGYHDLTGLPWWVVIVTSTMAFRTALLPLLILQLKKVGEISVLLPKLPPPLPPPLSGRSFRDQYILFRNKRRELGCPSFFWNFAFFTVQFPCFFLWMTSIRRMCLDNHLGFDTGGALWFQNLTDFPHSILGSVFPISIAGLHFINVQISFRGSVLNTPGILGILAKYYKLYLDLLAVPLLLIGFQIPQGSLVYWTTNSLLSSVQILSLRNPFVRKKLGLPDAKMFAKSRTTTKNGSLENTMEQNDSILTRNITSKENVEDRTKVTSIENNLHESSSSLEHKITEESLSPEELLNLALEYFASGHLDEALPLLRLATEKDPGLIRALIAMGQIYCSKGSLEESAEYFERAVSKIREEIQEEELGLLVLALYGAGFSRINQGRKAEGIEHLKRIGELKEPESPVNKVCYYRGLVLLASQLFNDGEKYEAAKYLRRAAAYDPAINAMLKECEG